ncbi:glutathione peroxidase [Lysobacter silvisoli]|uniref:Glutathione peroxidase n=1 Tax=Lysobacter silvisoli TaxID=2293254 RepID=A0A371K394_9GAMM|nr:glutathione peroxidase [Lysobacter silvisoli]RDZ28401.1 glutathione peroxidase [Lysobacter silvisoli]
MRLSSPQVRRSAAVAALSLLLVAGLASAAGALLDRSFRPLAGKAPVNLQRQYGGDVLLVVNTASKCGFTPQFEALEGLQAKYKAQGFAVLGFPSGDFKAQEFDDEKQIQEFCTLTYGVKFPMFEKVHVIGDQATPLYRDLAQAAGEAPKWNFHKYLIGRDGRLIASYGSKTKPDDPAVVAAIEAALKTPRGKRG